MSPRRGRPGRPRRRRRRNRSCSPSFYYSPSPPGGEGQTISPSPLGGEGWGEGSVSPPPQSSPIQGEEAGKGSKTLLFLQKLLYVALVFGSQHHQRLDALLEVKDGAKVG